MSSKIIAIISVLFFLSACETTKTAGQAGNQGDTSDAYYSDSSSYDLSSETGQAAEKYRLLSKDLATFANIPGSDIGARASDRVFFEFDSSVLTLAAQDTIDRQVQWLKDNPNRKVTVEGHCDERGTREYNLALGDRRANAVKNYLVSSGISASRVYTISYGKERPAVVGSYSAAWAENRRGVTIPE